MAQWVRLMLGNGMFNGKRLVSEKGFEELTRKQINIAGSVDYGLGWFLRTWAGHKVVEHGGNIDGFNAQVAFMPDQKVGFVLLTNVTASPIDAIAMNTIWKNLVDAPTATEAKAGGDPGGDPKKEAGKYLMPAGMSFDVSWKENKLVLTVPGQPPYPLENLSGRRYKLAAPVPDGYFATFRPIKDKPSETELFMEQPQGNLVLPRVTADKPTDAAAGTNGTPANSSLISTDELIAKMVEALGGEENLRKHKSSVTEVEIDLESQGVLAKGLISARAAARSFPTPPPSPAPQSSPRPRPAPTDAVKWRSASARPAAPVRRNATAAAYDARSWPT
jgi:hypothetical protein